MRVNVNSYSIILGKNKNGSNLLSAKISLEGLKLNINFSYIFPIKYNKDSIMNEVNDLIGEMDEKEELFWLGFFNCRYSELSEYFYEYLKTSFGEFFPFINLYKEKLYKYNDFSDPVLLEEINLGEKFISYNNYDFIVEDRLIEFISYKNQISTIDDFIKLKRLLEEYEQFDEDGYIIKWLNEVMI